MNLFVRLLLGTSFSGATADACSQHRSCGACTSMSGCSWCGLFAATDNVIEMYQGFGRCQKAGAQCDAAESFPAIYKMFDGLWEYAYPLTGTLAKAKATSNEVKVEMDCPTYDPENDKNIFDPSKQSCEACVRHNTGNSDDEPLWVSAGTVLGSGVTGSVFNSILFCVCDQGVFAHGAADGGRDTHQGSYCLDNYHENKWPVLYPMTNRDNRLYAVGVFVQTHDDCLQKPLDCDLPLTKGNCELVIGRHRCCAWASAEFVAWDGKLQIYGGFCTALTEPPADSIHLRTGLKPLLTADFGEGHSMPLVNYGNKDLHPENLIFNFATNTCEKCLAYDAHTKWCQSKIMNSEATDLSFGGGVCVWDGSDACGELDGYLNDELSIVSEEVTNCDTLPRPKHWHF